MELLNANQVKSQTLDHLGLVAATIHELELIERIDGLLPVSIEKGARLTMGQRIAGMILMGLGFIDTRLYLFAESLKDKPLEVLIGEGVTAEAYTDDALGRALDAVHAYGVENFFGQIAYGIALSHGYLDDCLHGDSSSLSVYGDYEFSEEELKEMVKPPEGSLSTPEVTYGYSKAHRPDLKQVVINMATTGSLGFPLWMEAHSGNASDQKILMEMSLRIKEFAQELQPERAFLYVADSAMYGSCLKQTDQLLWLSRAPEKLKEVRELLSEPDSYFQWEDYGNGYKVCTLGVEHGGVKQYWGIVQSEHAYYREIKTLTGRIEKAKEAAEKELWHLSVQRFGCEADAKTEASKLGKRWKYHRLDFKVEPVMGYEGKGRPKSDAVPKLIGYRVQGELKEDEVEIERVKRRKGRFIVASNDLKEVKVKSNELLKCYKEQSRTESGFKFIKDDSFQVSSIYLENPGRVAALMSVMVLCLMVYNVAQHRLREALKEANETLPNQKGKETDNPSLKWVFFMFLGIQLLYIETDALKQSLVINLSERSRKVIRLFGPKAMRIYGISTKTGQYMSTC